MATLEKLDQRFQTQASWTSAFQKRILDCLTDYPAAILEVGCGTGAFLEHFKSLTPVDHIYFGIDISFSSLVYAQKHRPFFRIQADGHAIPFETNQFDIVLCHYLLLWVQNPIKVIREMIRVTKPGGMMVIAAEPDYIARIDLPAEMEKAGTEQTASLIEQGIDPAAGRNLLKWLGSAGAANPLLGIHGAEYQGADFSHFLKQEATQLAADSRKCDPDGKTRMFTRLFMADPVAEKMQFLFVPTFYAIARKQ